MHLGKNQGKCGRPRGRAAHHTKLSYTPHGRETAEAKVVVLVGNCCFRGRRVMSGDAPPSANASCNLHLDCVVDPPACATGFRHRGESRGRARFLQRPACGSFFGLWARERSSADLRALHLTGTNEKERAWTVTRLGYDRPRPARARVRRNRTRRGPPAIARRRSIHCEPR